MKIKIGKERCPDCGLKLFSKACGKVHSSWFGKQPIKDNTAKNGSRPMTK